jgi:ribosomal protein RSM22 (predicted rRNA methylase)
MFNSHKDQTVKQIAKQRVYSWQPINYDQHKSFLYLMSRSAEEYAVIMRILSEIQKRDPTFQPQSFFDFGAGVGTGTWAASELWKSTIFEYYLVDSSKYMNELSEILLRDGDQNKSMSLREVYFRQFLPSREHKYDLVLSAYSMFELPSLKQM